MTIILTWQLRVTLNSIRISSDVSIKTDKAEMPWFPNLKLLVLIENHSGRSKTAIGEKEYTSFWRGKILIKRFLAHPNAYSLLVSHCVSQIERLDWMWFEKGPLVLLWISMAVYHLPKKGNLNRILRISWSASLILVLYLSCIAIVAPVHPSGRFLILWKKLFYKHTIVYFGKSLWIESFESSYSLLTWRSMCMIPALRPVSP